MTKPKYVYHGSGKKLEGDKLIPKKATDLGENPDNLLEGIYASDWKEDAIIMDILSCKGVRSAGSHVEKNKVEEIIYDGWPQQDYFWLYILQSKKFESRPRGSHQYISLTPVKPEKIERLAVKDYIHLVRRATEEEKKKWFGKYEHKIGKK